MERVKPRTYAEKREAVIGAFEVGLLSREQAKRALRILAAKYRPVK